MPGHAQFSRGSLCDCWQAPSFPRSLSQLLMNRPWGGLARLPCGGGPGAAVGDREQPRPVTSVASGWPSAPPSGSGDRTASVRRCERGAGGSGGPRGRCREAAEERLGVRGDPQLGWGWEGRGSTLGRWCAGGRRNPSRRRWWASRGPEPWLASDVGSEVK